MVINSIEGKGASPDKDRLQIIDNQQIVNQEKTRYLDKIRNLLIFLKKNKRIDLCVCPYFLDLQPALPGNNV